MDTVFKLMITLILLVLFSLIMLPIFIYYFICAIDDIISAIRDLINNIKEGI